MGKLQKQIVATLMLASVLSPVAHAEEYVGVMRVVDDKVVYLGEDESFWGYTEEENIDEEEEEEEYFEEEASAEDDEKPTENKEQEKKPEDKKQDAPKNAEEKKPDVKPSEAPKKTEDKKEQPANVQMPSNVSISYGAPISSSQNGVDLILRSGAEYKSIDVEEFLVCPDEVEFDGFSFFVTDAEIVDGALQFLAMSSSDIQTFSAKEDVATKFTFANHDVWVVLAPRISTLKSDVAGIKPEAPKDGVKPEPTATTVKPEAPKDATKSEPAKDSVKASENKKSADDSEGTDDSGEQEGVDEISDKDGRTEVGVVESGEDHAYGSGQDETMESVDEES